MSTQLAGLMATVDTDNGGVPFESPSNKNFKMDGCCLEDGTEVTLNFEQTNIIAGYGIVTALNFMGMGWVARNNYTACYPGNTDVKDQFIPVNRMFSYVGNTLIRMFWSKLDNSEDGYATGTDNAAPGWAMVGEDGPEMMFFNGGEKVLNAAQTAALRDKVRPAISAIPAPSGSSSDPGIPDAPGRSGDTQAEE